MAYENLVPDIARRYGISYHEILPAQKGYRNESYPIRLDDGRMVNMLFYKREPAIADRVAFADTVADRAAVVGLPVRTRFDPRLLQVRGNKGSLVVGLYEYLPGYTIPWEAFSRKHIVLLGWAMSDLHAALKDVEGGVNIAEEIGRLIERMRAYFSDQNVTDAMRQKLGVAINPDWFDRFSQLCKEVNDLPGAQALHMDMVRGNILFGDATRDSAWVIDTTALTGIIDFEKAAQGNPLFDIARTLSFLLTDCDERLHPRLLRYFIHSGYNKRGKSLFPSDPRVDGTSHTSLLRGLVGLFLLHDFYKFLVHAPYEALKDNHHYIRTRNVLAAYAVIRYR